MPFCQTVFREVELKQINSVLTSLTKECFVGGQAAYKLKDGSFSIDAGKNDIRAIYNDEDESIKFICRYQRELNFYDKKLSAFAAKNGIALKKGSKHTMIINEDMHTL